jgi:hypothetical protein
MTKKKVPEPAPTVAPEGQRAKLSNARKRKLFLEALAQGYSITHALKRSRMSKSVAYDHALSCA